MSDLVTGVCTADSGAYFSPDSVYRYALWRRFGWKGIGKQVMFVGLNPSVADEITDDMTIKKCIGFAKRWGYSGIYMLNLFGYVSTNPKALVTADDPVGKGNAEALSYYRSHAALVVVAWGSIDRRYRAALRWEERINSTLADIAQPVFCLGKTSDGSPRHPSRISYNTPLEPFA